MRITLLSLLLLVGCEDDTSPFTKAYEAQLEAERSAELPIPLPEPTPEPEPPSDEPQCLTISEAVLVEYDDGRIYQMPSVAFWDGLGTQTIVIVSSGVRYPNAFFLGDDTQCDDPHRPGEDNDPDWPQIDVPPGGAPVGLPIGGGMLPPDFGPISGGGPGFGQGRLAELIGSGLIGGLIGAEIEKDDQMIQSPQPASPSIP